ncbi:MAG TPA: hypothetical protein VK540_25565 [Polyangiaceae bacterium]|nr:hypothetical protein [Polyangiaceae bacterium]
MSRPGKRMQMRFACGAGHMIARDSNDLFTEAVLDFLDRLGQDEEPTGWWPARREPMTPRVPAVAHEVAIGNMHPLRDDVRARCLLAMGLVGSFISFDGIYISTAD